MNTFKVAVLLSFLCVYSQSGFSLKDAGYERYGFANIIAANVEVADPGLIVPVRRAEPQMAQVGDLQKSIVVLKTIEALRLLKGEFPKVGRYNQGLADKIQREVFAEKYYKLWAKRLSIPLADLKQRRDRLCDLQEKVAEVLPEYGRLHEEGKLKITNADGSLKNKYELVSELERWFLNSPNEVWAVRFYEANCIAVLTEMREIAGLLQNEMEFGTESLTQKISRINDLHEEINVVLTRGNYPRTLAKKVEYDKANPFWERMGEVRKALEELSAVGFCFIETLSVAGIMETVEDKLKFSLKKRTTQEIQRINEIIGAGMEVRRLFNREYFYLWRYGPEVEEIRIKIDGELLDLFKVGNLVGGSVLEQKIAEVDNMRMEALQLIKQNEQWYESTKSALMRRGGVSKVEFIRAIVESLRWFYIGNTALSKIDIVQGIESVELIKKISGSLRGEMWCSNLKSIKAELVHLYGETETIWVNQRAQTLHGYEAVIYDNEDIVNQYKHQYIRACQGISDAFFAAEAYAQTVQTSFFERMCWGLSRFLECTIAE